MEQHLTAAADSELAQAWADLRRTISKFNHKVQRTEDQFAPRRVFSTYAWPIAGAAGALGFLLGLDGHRRLEWLAAGALLGAAASSVVKSVEHPGKW